MQDGKLIEIKEEERTKPKPKQCFSVRRMLPPGTQNYYFTIDDERVFLNPDKPNTQSSSLLHGALQLMKLKVDRSNIIQNIV